jgi:hypothetical protein
VVVVITEISSAHGDKNSALSNSNEVIHGTGLISQHCKKVKNYTKQPKIKGRFTEVGCVRICMEHEHTMRARVHDARLLAQKPAHLLNDAFMEVVGLPTTYGSAPKPI